MVQTVLEVLVLNEPTVLEVRRSTLGTVSTSTLSTSTFSTSTFSTHPHL
jgi:hypothetical protein